MQRGRSVDPAEFVNPHHRYSYASSSPPHHDKRAQSAAPPTARLSGFYPGNEPVDGSSTNPKSAEKALINQHVNPYQEFPSLRYDTVWGGSSLAQLTI